MKDLQLNEAFLIATDGISEDTEVLNYEDCLVDALNNRTRYFSLEEAIGVAPVRTNTFHLVLPEVTPIPITLSLR